MKMMNKSSLFLILKTCLLIILLNNVQAQDKYFFENLSVSDGLSNSVVLCTYQDRLGYLWIGTMDGLNRYDGYDIKVYKNIPGDSTSLINNIIFSIGEDKNGNLLVGTFDFVSKYNRESDNFTNIEIDKGPLLNASRVMSFLNDSKGRLWITTTFTGVQLFDDSTNNFKAINIRNSGDELISNSGESLSRFRTVEMGFQHIMGNVTELKNGNILTAQKDKIYIYNSSQNEFQTYINLKSPLTNIASIFEDSSGKLWINGTDDIYIYNPSNYDLKPLNVNSHFPKQLRKKYFFTIYEEPSKQIFIGSKFGIIESDQNATTFSAISQNIANLNPNNLYRDKFGIYWISSGGKGLFRFDPARKPFQFFAINKNQQSNTITTPVKGIVRNPLQENELLFSLDGQGIFSFTRETLKFKKIDKHFTDLLIADKKGNLWYTDNNSLNTLNIKTGKIESFPYLNPEYSREYLVTRIKFGPDNNIWLSNTQGVQTFNPETKKFRRLSSIMTKAISPELLSKVRAFAHAETPLLSIVKVGEAASISKEFSLEKPTKVLILSLGEGRATNLVLSMFDYGWLEDKDGKNIWSSEKIEETFYAGGGFKNRISLECLDLPPGTFKTNFVSDIGHSYGAFNVTAPPDSDWYGIQVFKLNDQHYTWFTNKLKSESDNTHYPTFERINDIVFSRKYINTAWMASTGIGLIKQNLKDNTQKYYRFDDGTERFPLVNRLENIIEDKDGLLWIKNEEGLIKFNPETEHFQIISPKDGLASNQVSFMIEDLNGNLWFGTPGGISMLNKSNKVSNLSFINYDNKDGINSLPLNSSVTMTEDGEIFYGGFGGLNAFYPGSANKTLPMPIIEGLSISGVPIEKQALKYNLKKNISETRQIKLPFSDNNLEIEFASIHFSRPYKNKLAYMLQGIDEDWRYTNRRFASYLNLPPGEYVFRLKGSNGDGIWNPEETTLKITITPPWWRTTFAYIVYVIFFMVFVFTIDRVQRRRIINKERAARSIKDAELRATVAESQAKVVQAENDRKTKELEEARQLQLSMLPKKLPQLPNLDIAVYMQTATEVGGDYYDFQVDDDGSLIVALGDATGHGMQAGTLVTLIKGLFTSEASNKEILKFFNDASKTIKEINLGRLLMAFSLLKIKGNQLEFSSAGLPPMYIYRNGARRVEEINMQGMPLGAMKNFDYKLNESELNKGDYILLLSDGYPELTNSKNEQLGYERLKSQFAEIAGESPEEIINKLKDAGSDWTNDKDPDDDVTFVVIKVK